MLIIPLNLDSVLLLLHNSKLAYSARKHTKREEKVKLNKEAHQDARQTWNWTFSRNKAHGNLVQEAEKREPENEVEHMADENYVIFPE